MDFGLLFYSSELIYVCISFICLLIYGSTWRVARPFLKKKARYVLKINMLAAILKVFQLPYLFHIESPEHLFCVTGVDILTYLPLNIVFWVYYLQIGKQPQKVLYPLFVLAGTIILFMEGWVILNVESFSVFRNLIQYLIWTIISAQIVLFGLFLYVGYHSEISSFKMSFSNDQYFPKSYILPSAVIILIGLTFNMISFYGQNHWGKLIVNIYFGIIHMYVLIHWIPTRLLGESYLQTQTSGGRKQIDDKDANRNVDSETKAKMIFSSLLSDSVLSGEERYEALNPFEKKEQVYQLILEKANEVIREHRLYLNPELHLTDLLPYLNTNRTYLSKAINQNENMNFYRLILSYRIHHLRELLRDNPDIKFNDAAVESGFSSSKNLSRIFRQELDMTPTKFRTLPADEQHKVLDNYNLILNRI